MKAQRNWRGFPVLASDVLDALHRRLVDDEMETAVTQVGAEMHDPSTIETVWIKLADGRRFDLQLVEVT